MLLVVALVGLELWLQGKSMPAMQSVTHQAPATDQSLLVPSAVCHHELQRMLKTKHQASRVSGNHVFRVNSFGCRGDEPEIPASTGSYRILVLGDDNICGTAVDENDTVSAHLQRFLAKQTMVRLEVINCGIPGYCPLLSWLKFEHDLAKLKPDLVVLHVDMTDIADDLCYRSLLLAAQSCSLFTSKFATETEARQSLGPFCQTVCDGQLAVCQGPRARTGDSLDFVWCGERESIRLDHG